MIGLAALDHHFRPFRGTWGSNPVRSSGESVSVVNRDAVGQRRGIRGGLRVDWDVRRDGLAVSRPSLTVFLCRALLQSHFGKAQTGCRLTRAPALGARAWGKYASLRLACEQPVLLRPVQRQIEFAQTRRGESGGLLAFEDRLDQPRAQECQADEAPDVASAGALTLGHFLNRSGAAGGQLLKPRPPTCERLISTGSHLEPWFCSATPGSSSLVSVPRRLNSIVAGSSIVPSLSPDAPAFPPKTTLRRTLMTIVFSSTITWPTRARTILARSADEPRSAAARRAARSSIFRTWSLRMLTSPAGSTNFAGWASQSNGLGLAPFAPCWSDPPTGRSARQGRCGDGGGGSGQGSRTSPDRRTEAGAKMRL